MTTKILNLGSWFITAILLVFTVRRWLFMLVALVPDKKKPPPGASPAITPHVLLLIPIRNEAGSIPDLCESIAHLEYAHQKLSVVFINDGSTDESELLLQARTAGPNNWHLLSLERNVGKAEALNVALKTFSQGELVAVYDADERPRPDALRWLVRPFSDPAVGGVSGRRAVSNSLASPAAGYTTIEGLVHQLVTMRAKDKLRLAPALLGANCIYRREALLNASNFRPGALLEDSDLTVRLARLGWKTRFEPYAVSYHEVPQSISGYWRQHTRWARGFNEVAKNQSGLLLADRRLSLYLRLEILVFTLGYLDRLALLAGILLLFSGRRWVAAAVVLSLLTPILQILTALKIGRQSAAMWWHAAWLPMFFILDVAMALAGFWNTIRQTPQRWEERQSRR